MIPFDVETVDIFQRLPIIPPALFAASSFYVVFQSLPTTDAPYLSPLLLCTLIARRFSAKSRQQHFNIICMRNSATESSSPLAHSIKCQNVIAVSILLIVCPLLCV